MNLAGISSLNSANSRYFVPKRHHACAFTLFELLVVILILAVLALTLLPALAREHAGSQTTLCFSNFRQLASAWLMYADDNQGTLPGNHWQDEQNWLTYSNENWVSGWEGVDGTGGNGLRPTQGGPDNTNTTLLVNPMYSTLGEYTKSPSLYRCPSSIVLAPVSLTFSPRYPLCRTVSMNCWIGYNTDPDGSQSISGSPLFNYSACPDQVFTKTTAITGGINPSTLFVFIEERAESIDDGWFEAIPNSGNTIYNWPGNYHNNGTCSVSFADGHVESHIWHNLATSVSQEFFLASQVAIINEKWGQANVSGAQSADLTWLSSHATCSK